MTEAKPKNDADEIMAGGKCFWDAACSCMTRLLFAIAHSLGVCEAKPSFPEMPVPSVHIEFTRQGQPKILKNLATK